MTDGCEYIPKQHGHGYDRRTDCECVQLAPSVFASGVLTDGGPGVLLPAPPIDSGTDDAIAPRLFARLDRLPPVLGVSSPSSSSIPSSSWSFSPCAPPLFSS